MNVLLISPFPFMPARHGGQLRVKAMYDFFKNRGDNIQAIGIRSSWTYTEQDGFVSVLDRAVVKQVFTGPVEMLSYGMGLLFATVDTFYETLVDQIKITPDVVIIEHPWLFRFAKRYIESLDQKPYLIFDAHNVECVLQKKIQESRKISEKELEINIKQIKDLEILAAQSSDLVVTVSHSDAEWFHTQVSKPIVVVENGISDWDRGLADCGVKLPDEYCLFCGSSHLPNKEGFFYYFGGLAFGSLNETQRVVVAGAVGNTIVTSSVLDQTACLREKLLIFGEVDDITLAVLRNRAKAIVLPINYGGGTNLKTAEALLSGKYVVASRTAMRGYSEFEGEPGVFVVETPSEFKRTLRHVMQLPELDLDSNAKAKRRNVMWDMHFQEFKDFLRKEGL